MPRPPSPDWEQVARDKGLLIESRPVRLDYGHVPADTGYRERRQPTNVKHGAGLVTPPPKGISGVELVLAVRVVSESNNHASGHWSARYRRFKAQAAVLDAVLGGVTLPPLPVNVLWTKLGGQRLDDDNLRSSFKGLRDFLAKSYKTDDAAGSGIGWNYDQVPGGKHGVRVLIAAAGA